MSNVQHAHASRLTASPATASPAAASATVAGTAGLAGTSFAGPMGGRLSPRARGHVAASGAVADFLSGLARVDYWATLAWFDIRGRYRRTVLGPFWSVLNSVIFISLLASVYALLWKVSLAQFLPYVAAGYFAWTFFAASVNECCSLFHHHAETLKTTPLVPTALLMRVIARNAIVFAHNLLVFVGIALVFGVPLGLAWLVVPGLLIMALTVLGVGTVCALLCSRYRDLEQIVQSTMQALFFVTPILWQERLLPAHASWLADWNPVLALLRLVRDPLLGIAPAAGAYYVALLVMTLALGLGAVTYAACRQRLAFWL
jgi:ABC-type polysaccharide/polyol phosphate export permease